jgi:hypothetical protein
MIVVGTNYSKNEAKICRRCLDTSGQLVTGKLQQRQKFVNGKQLYRRLIYHRKTTTTAKNFSSVNSYIGDKFVTGKQQHRRKFFHR